MPKVNLPVCIPSCMTSSMTTTSSVLQPPTRLGTWCPFTMEVPDLYRTTWCHYPPRHRPTTTSNKTRTAATTALRAPILDVSQICSLYTVTQKRTMGIFSCNSSKHCLIFIIFGKSITERYGNQKLVYSKKHNFTAPGLCLLPLTVQCRRYGLQDFEIYTAA